ncbi:MAG TPA: sigma-70 family RNA polymerase sigma factor, partial [Kofleriaceae bacterium]|nr:sigma-70 family RNA polymerase sigma factor [Kofleriaceae bacterium]
MTTRPDRVLAELDGLRALARSLVHGDADADDLLQDVAVATLEHPPAAEGPARPWLAAVLRNRWRMDRRSDARRRAREQASAPELEADAEVDPIERARMLQRLADALVALDEPFRATVIRRYLDGRSAAEIARELGVAAGTVRWRLKTGLERLRGELDRAAPRARWQLAIAPVGLWRASHVAKGALIVKAKIQLTAVLVLLVLAGVGAYVALHRPHRPELPAPQATLMAKVAVGVKRTPREPAPAPRPHAAPSMRPLVEPASAPGGVLAGRVLDWSTGDGIAGAELTFSADDGAVTARTGDDGSFELAPPHAGQFTLAAIAASGFLPYAPEYMHSPVRAHLAAGSAIRHVTLYLYPALDYHGLVVDAAGAPVAGAHVRLLATPDQRIDKLQSEWTSDARGTFVFHGADDAVLEATAGSKRGWARLDNAVAISKHMTIKLADVAERDAAITGRVVDGNDHPLAEVLVSADPSGPRGPSSRYGGEATSGPDGTFRIDGLDRERYDLTADSDGFAATTVPAIAGGSKGVTVVLETGLPLAGRVVAPGGDPVAAFTVTAYLRAGAAREIAATRSIADPSGHFEIRVPPGSYELIATAASWAPSPVTTAAA